MNIQDISHFKYLYASVVFFNCFIAVATGLFCTGACHQECCLVMTQLFFAALFMLLSTKKKAFRAGAPPVGGEEAWPSVWPGEAGSGKIKPRSRPQDLVSGSGLVVWSGRGLSDPTRGSRTHGVFGYGLPGVDSYFRKWDDVVPVFIGSCPMF